jgi:hypothetical protein
LLVQGDIPPADIGNDWADYTFATPVTLLDGNSYQLVLSSTGSGDTAGTGQI